MGWQLGKVLQALAGAIDLDAINPLVGSDKAVLNVRHVARAIVPKRTCWQDKSKIEKNIESQDWGKQSTLGPLFVVLHEQEKWSGFFRVVISAPDALGLSDDVLVKKWQ